ETARANADYACPGCPAGVGVFSATRVNRATMWAGPTFEYSMVILPWSVEWLSSVAAASRSMVRWPLPRWRMPLGSALPERMVTKAEPGDLDWASRCQSNDFPSAFCETV